MKIQIALCLFVAATFSSCSSTSTTTASHQTLEQRLTAKYAGTDMSANPAPPAEGPDDVPADAPNTVADNPALMPSPALRQSAAGGL